MGYTVVVEGDMVMRQQGKRRGKHGHPSPRKDSLKHLPGREVIPMKFE